MNCGNTAAKWAKILIVYDQSEVDYRSKVIAFDEVQAAFSLDR